MTDPGDHAVDAADEQRHVPDGELFWNESYYLDFVADDGAIAGYVRIGLYPNLGVTWWTTMIVGAGRSLVASVSYELPVAGGTGLILRSAGHDIDGVVEDPLRIMSVRGTAPAVRHRHPADVYRGTPGEPTSIGLDMTWSTDGVPYHYQVTTRYEVPCLVDGEVRVGDERIPVHGQGQRDHSWGVRDWWAFGWCWAAVRLDDGTRVHLADIRIPGSPLSFGYLQPSPGEVRPVTSLAVSETLGDEGLPIAARASVEPGGLEVAVTPIAFGPVLLAAPDGRTSRFARAAARFETEDGRSGMGWIEWNQPQAPTGAR